jgi:hypothetical protein
MGMPKYTALIDLTNTCKRLYEAHGFVKWSDVGKVHGISRQAVLNRLQTAVERGDLEPGTLDMWRSTSARIAQSRANKDLRDEHAKLRLPLTLTPINKKWLDTECLAQQCRPSDIINGLINKARIS